MTDDIQHIAKTLRKRLTDAEKLLWSYLTVGCKFRRQEPIGKYIADFVCYEKGLIIEVDGGQHAEEKQKDNKRYELDFLI